MHLTCKPQLIHVRENEGSWPFAIHALSFGLDRPSRASSSWKQGGYLLILSFYKKSCHDVVVSTKYGPSTSSISVTGNLLEMQILGPYPRPGLPWWLSGEESVCLCRRCRFHLWVGKSMWRRKRQPTPVFLLGKSYGQKSLAGYSPWGCRVKHHLVTKQQPQTCCWVKV